jgi:chemotaxis protein CheD
MAGFGKSAPRKSTQRIVVGVGDMVVSSEIRVVLSTFALGSCVGVASFDPEHGVGGLLHIMLPTASIAPEKARSQPFLFADTGMKQFLSMLTTMGANLDSCRFVLAGGASIMTADGAFLIGQKNIDAVRLTLEQSGIRPSAEFLGGYTSRSMHLDLACGKLEVMVPNQVQEVSLA